MDGRPKEVAHEHGFDDVTASRRHRCAKVGLQRSTHGERLCHQSPLMPPFPNAETKTDNRADFARFRTH